MKPSPDRQNSSTVSNTVPKARVNHAWTNVSQISVTSPSPTHWLGAEPIIDKPEIRIPFDTNGIRIIRTYTNEYVFITYT